MTINSDLNFAGNLAFNVNKSLPGSNDLVVVSGALNNTGTGTLAVTTIGPAFVSPGDKFTLFSQPVLNGAALTVVSATAGTTWSNNLAVDGSIIALAVVNTNRPVLNASASGNTLNFGWPGNLGWTLQTNSVSLLSNTLWFTYPGSATVTNVSIPINPAKTNVFFPLACTPVDEGITRGCRHHLGCGSPS